MIWIIFILVIIAVGLTVYLVIHPEGKTKKILGKCPKYCTRCKKISKNYGKNALNAKAH